MNEDERQKMVIETADKAFSEFLKLEGEQYFGEGIFTLRNGSYPFLIMLKSTNGTFRGVTMDKGGASNIEGTLTKDKLDFVRSYTFNPKGIDFNYYKIEDTDLWDGRFQVRGLSYVGQTNLRLLSKKSTDKRLLSLMGVEGVLKIIEESPLGNMKFR